MFNTYKMLYIVVDRISVHNISKLIFFLLFNLGYFYVSLDREKTTTTVVTANTTISSDSSQPNDNNALEDFIRVQELIQKHFDIPLVS